MTCTRAFRIRFRTNIAPMSALATWTVSRPSRRLISRFHEGSYCRFTENTSLPEWAWGPSTCLTTSTRGTCKTILPARGMEDSSIPRGENTAANSFWSFNMKPLFLLICLFLIPPSSIVAADSPSSLPTAEEVVSRMAALDLERQSSMEGYDGMRRYLLENRGLQKHAELLVSVQGDHDGTKHFEVLSEDGWKAANTHVLRKMLDSESETSRPELSATTKLNFTNYEFALVGKELVAGRTTYVLEVAPKRKDKYLFQGRIWVDAEDYA